MSKDSLNELNDVELTNKFIATARSLGEVISLWLPTSGSSKELVRIGAEMRRRGYQFRIKLAPLLEDKDRFVQYYAARQLLAIMPERSRRIIEENAKQGDALAGHAGMLLHTIDSGIYRPK